MSIFNQLANSKKQNIYTIAVLIPYYGFNINSNFFLDRTPNKYRYFHFLENKCLKLDKYDIINKLIFKNLLINVK